MSNGPRTFILQIKHMTVDDLKLYFIPVKNVGQMRIQHHMATREVQARQGYS
jgi:hypothetical protein